MKWGSKNWLCLTAVTILLLVVLASGCCSLAGTPIDRAMGAMGYEADGADDSTAVKQAVHGTLTTGEPVEAAAFNMPAAGGIVTVNAAGTPVDGMQISTVEGAYPEGRDFEISYAPVTDHTFGSHFTPASPLISIDNGGGYAEEYVQVRIPVNASPDEFVMAFYYDRANQTLEGLPLVARDDSSITVATLHFCDLVVSKIGGSELDAINIADSGFKPGTDDWEFANNGSAIAPGGHCVGQSISMIWYYENKKQKENAPALYGLYDNNGRDKTPGIGGDDVPGVRLASLVQKDMRWTEYYSPRIHRLLANETPATQFRLFKYSILVTRKPQVVYLSGLTGAHAIVCYKVDGNALYVADPNYPGKVRRILLNDNVLGPYPTGNNAQEIAKQGESSYTNIYYAADTALVPVYCMPARWGQLEAGTIGDGSFPPYTLNLTVTNDNGKQSYYDFDGGKNAVQKTATVEGRKVTLTGRQNPGVSIGNGLNAHIYVDGNPSKTTWTLHEGHNLIGVEGLTTVNNQTVWIGFDWIDLYYEPSAITQPESGREILHGKEYYGSGALRREYDYYLDADGNKHVNGELREYFESGQVEYVRHITEGVDDGLKYTYLEDGTLYRVQEYKNGTMVKETNYY